MFERSLVRSHRLLPVPERHDGAPAQTGTTCMPQSENGFLATLTASDFAVIEPDLTIIELRHSTILYRTGDRLDQVYFPRSAVLSLVVNLPSGQMAEIAMLGRDGVVGGCVGMGVPLSLNDVTVQIPGSSLVLPASKLKDAA